MHVEGLEVYVDQQPEALVEALLRAGLTNGQQALATIPHLRIGVTTKGKSAVITGTILTPFFCPLKSFDLGLEGVSGGMSERLTPTGVILSKRLLRSMPQRHAFNFTMHDVSIRAEKYVVIDLHHQTTFLLENQRGRIMECHPALY